MRERTIGHLRGRTSWRTWAAMLCVPALLMGLLVLAFHDPDSEMGQVRAAVVNDDTPVTIDGQTRPMGRQLVKELVNSNNDDYDWVLTTAGDAADGLRNGEYTVAVEIPSDFSAKATSVAGDDAGAASQASVTITTAEDSPLLDARVGTALAEAAERSLGQQITQTYVDTVLTSMGTLHDNLATASDGADTLAESIGTADDGAAQLATGADTLATGTDTLASGQRSLAAGLSELKTQTADLPTQTQALADGATQLATGAHQVSDGTTSVADGATQLAGATQTIGDGADTLSASASQLSDALANAQSQTADLPTRTQALADGANSVSAGVDALATQLQQLSGACAQSAEACQAASAGLGELSTQLGALQQGASQVAAGASTLNDNAADLSAGIGAAAAGAGQISDGAASLATGAHEAATGANDLATGATNLRSGAQQVASGADDLSSATGSLASSAPTLTEAIASASSGADQLVTGTESAADGAHDLADGATTLHEGTTRLKDGSGTLASGLRSAAGQVPSYTADQRDQISQVVTTPLVSATSGLGSYARSAVALFGVLALWVAAIAFSVNSPAITRTAFASNLPTWQLALRSLGPTLLFSAGCALVVSTIATVALRPGAGAFFTVLAAAFLIELVFLAINQALGSIHRIGGRVVALAVLVLAVVGGVWSAQPAWLQSVASFLPTDPAVALIRVMAVPTSAGLVSALAALIAWWAAALVVLIALTGRARTTTLLPDRFTARNGGAGQWV
ncbi:MAG: YhgE/Pip domain-containing protein [Propionibacteriaceae bacterium]|uniref:Phage infection protein, YhgE, N-terminal n=1 Tax=Propionibacterium ruminifibrarum TaxID=1962131 RepID=A0A375HX81_9ACTN|nr:YhgE/Pip domain-containing protein [Propionibacterium ruminifibrarum]MBE6476530.1 YhgE/Pip domain-containing protein [Propionibacteriaceae bacterium]SPF67083.1 Phage infection protein, YhgE, N-terminal [Propionibacterium ruminifibrarum]